MPTFPRPYDPNVKPDFQEVLAAMRDGRWRRHPLGRGLVGAWFLAEGAGTRTFDVTGRYPASIQGTASWSRVASGPALSPGSNGDALISPIGGVGAHTLVVISYPTVSSNPPNSYGAFGRGLYGGDANGDTIQYVRSDGYWDFTIRDTTYHELTPGKFQGNAVNRFAGTFDGVNARAYLQIDNGPIAAAGPIVLSGRTDNTHDFMIGAYPGNVSGTSFPGFIIATYLYGQALPLDNIAWLYHEPYAMLRAPQPYWLGYAASGGTPTTITPSTATKQASQTIPTLSVGVTIGVSIATAQCFTTTPTMSVSTTATPTTANQQADTTAPTVTEGTGATITPSCAITQSSTFTPALRLGITATPTTATTQSDQTTPTVQIGGAVTVATATANVQAVNTSPTMGVGTSFTANVANTQADSTTPSVTATTGATITPLTATVQGNTSIPTIQNGINLSPVAAFSQGDATIPSVGAVASITVNANTGNAQAFNLPANVGIGAGVLAGIAISQATGLPPTLTTAIALFVLTALSQAQSTTLVRYTAPTIVGMTSAIFGGTGPTSAIFRGNGPTGGVSK